MNLCPVYHTVYFLFLLVPYAGYYADDNYDDVDEKFVDRMAHFLPFYFIVQKWQIYTFARFLSRSLL